mmetsp:Transcript_3308/g.7518  ORF Transcript_3308/g.7518 Transcript_3308/m.7518 type:complete len:120 (+) Transcript_3308:1570-1929(+)
MALTLHSSHNTSHTRTLIKGAHERSHHAGTPIHSLARPHQNINQPQQAELHYTSIHPSRYLLTSHTSPLSPARIDQNAQQKSNTPISSLSSPVPCRALESAAPTSPCRPPRLVDGEGVH